MFYIPKYISDGFICDCYIGRVIAIKHAVEYDYMDEYCTLELVKELIKNPYRPLYLYRGEFTKTIYENGWEVGRKVTPPPVGQLIQVLNVGQGYGCINYLKLLDSIDDAVPIPRYYSEIVASRTDCYQI